MCLSYILQKKTVSYIMSGIRQLTKKYLVLKQNQLAYAPFSSNTGSENKTQQRYSGPYRT